MFKPRTAAATATPPSVELVRQRAKHRLMGVSVLVLAAVVLFPLLFDTQPRPLPVDIPIEIPSRKTVKPLTVEPPSEPSAEQSTSAGPKAADAKATAKAGGTTRAVADDDEVIISHSPARAPAVQVAPAVVAAVKPVVVKPEAAKPESMPSRAAAAVSPKDTLKDGQKEATRTAPQKEIHKDPAKETVKESPKPATPKDVAREPVKEPASVSAADAARAQALLEGKASSATAKPAAPAAPDAPGTRYIVQVGAFADSAIAQSARLKLERAGLKTYTHEAQTPEGKRIRVRLGPFATRAEAEKAAAKAKATGTAAAILTL